MQKMRPCTLISGGQWGSLQSAVPHSGSSRSCSACSRVLGGHSLGSGCEMGCSCSFERSDSRYQTRTVKQKRTRAGGIADGEDIARVVVLCTSSDPAATLALKFFRFILRHGICDSLHLWKVLTTILAPFASINLNNPQQPSTP